MRSLILLSFLFWPLAVSAHEDPRIGCVMNLRQIDAAKQMLQIEKGLSNGVPCEAAALTQYLLGGTMPRCPAGGLYTIGTIGIEPTCNVAGHSDAALQKDMKRQDTREHLLVWGLFGGGVLALAVLGWYLAGRRIVHFMALVTVAQPLSAQTYDSSVQFSPTSNPNGVWRYGFESTLGAAFTLCDSQGPFLSTPIDTWWPSSRGMTVQIFHNGTGTNYFDTVYHIEWESDELSLHPGYSGELAVLRFVAPAAGTYEVTVSFRGIDQEPGGTDVHVLTNDVSMFDQQVTGFHLPSAFGTTLSLAVSDTLDFAVGMGADGDYHGDSTGVHAMVTLARPRLSISLLSGARAEVAWVTNFTDYALEYAGNLAATTWNAVTNDVVITGNYFSVIVDTGASQRFFRLRKP